MAIIGFSTAIPRPRVFTAFSKGWKSSHHSWPLNTVDWALWLINEGARQNFFRKILRTRNFSGQISQLLSGERFPDLILIWIGHNNVDWAWRSPPGELQEPEKRLQRQ